MAWFDDLQRMSCSADHAARARTVKYDLDVTDDAAAVRVPTLVLHARGDALVPFDEGRQLAALVPDARLVPLDSANHILLEAEPAWDDLRREVTAFLPLVHAGRDAALDDLSRREREVLTLVADGEDNERIAAALHLSVRTVERHLSNCYAKLGLTGRAARVAAATRFARDAEPGGARDS